MVAKKHFLLQEWLRRGSSEKIILAGPATRKPYDFKMFIANENNKKQLCQLLLRVWSGRQAASRLVRTEMAVLIVEARESPPTRLIERRSELKVHIIISIIIST